MQTSVYRVRLTEGFVYVLARTREEVAKSYPQSEFAEATPEEMFRSAGCKHAHDRFRLEFGVVYKQ